MLRKLALVFVGALVFAGLTAFPAKATQAISFTSLGTIPAPYNAYDSSWCSWRSGPNVDTNANGSRIILADAKHYNCGGTPVNRFVYLSADGGATFTPASGLPSAAWGVVSSSPTGQYLAAAAHQGNLYTSRDYGATWSIATTPGVKPWWDVKMSADGSFMIATYDYNSIPYISTDYGVTWSALAGFPVGSWRDVGVSADGKVVAICINDGNQTNNGAAILVSRSGAVPTNYSSFTEVLNRPANVICGSIDMDAAGTRLAALSWTNDSVAIWNYAASNWSVVRQFTETWSDGYNGISMSSDGMTIFMPGWDQKPDYISFDGGVTSQYVTITDLPTRIGVAALSRDGSTLIQIASDRAYKAVLSGGSAPQQQAQPVIPMPLHKFTAFSGRKVISGETSTITLSGEGLAAVKSATLGGVSVEIVRNTAELIEMKIPASLGVGKHDLKLESPTLKLTFMDAVIVTAKPAPVIKPAQKTISCSKGSKTVKVTAVVPRCPTGFKKR
jgi:hypothetical protein